MTFLLTKYLENYNRGKLLGLDLAYWWCLLTRWFLKLELASESYGGLVKIKAC